jgi:predicted nucleic acid-binding protein
VIIDFSAWAEFFRRTGSAVHHALRSTIADSSTRLMTTDVIRLEILAGAHDDSLRKRMNSLLAGCEDVQQIPRADVDDAVTLFQLCQARGETVRAPSDCLIAAIAIRVDVPVLHADRDFDVLARHGRLRVVKP